MWLGQLIAAYPDARRGGADGDPDVRAVVHDTHDVVAGSLFLCVRGARVDGHELAAGAVAAGAVALVVDHALPLAVPQVVVPDVRRAMGPLAAAFWGNPSHDLVVVGVTGTSGKTTVTHLLCPVLHAAGLAPCAIIGTLSGARTTPEATDLQAMLAAQRDRGSSGAGAGREAGRAAVAMEVSSHGLALHRVDGTRFAVAVFTNLSQDHLDFHQTMDDYFAAKAALFTSGFTDRAVVCSDDPRGRELLARLSGARSGVTATAYSLADAEELTLSPAGASFRWRGEPVELALAGRFNVANALAAGAAAEALGIEPGFVARGLSAAAPVPGRFEAIDGGQPFTVLVDYAHKPDALDQALRAARELVTPGRRLLVVFGCGGDRDAVKRPLMGEVATRLADDVILTSDNPRSEDPQAIIDDIGAGVPAGAGATVAVEPDRRSAIGLAVAEARPGDVVVIAGKGHESTQTIGETVRPFDDREMARAALAAPAPGAPGGER
ncbi:MAG: UDP-N-acetylmuramoyl-L-alanyl-D-glutamate--2,6-diaminopimelate ligase [Acidimicrobiales bacterium]